jgi:antitoxin StbD
MLPPTQLVSVAEFSEPSKVIGKLKGQPVAIIDCDEMIGYFVPMSALCDRDAKVATKIQVESFLKEDLHKIDHVLEYLKDK